MAPVSLFNKSNGKYLKRRDCFIYIYKTVKRHLLIIFILITEAAIAQTTANDPNLKLWYDKSATKKHVYL